MHIYQVLGRHYFKFSMHINLCDVCNSLEDRLSTIIIPILQMKKWKQKELRNLPKMARLVGDRAEI